MPGDVHQRAYKLSLAALGVATTALGVAAYCLGM